MSARKVLLSMAAILPDDFAFLFVVDGPGFQRLKRKLAQVEKTRLQPLWSH